MNVAPVNSDVSEPISSEKGRAVCPYNVDWTFVVLSIVVHVDCDSTQWRNALATVRF